MPFNIITAGFCNSQFSSILSPNSLVNGAAVRIKRLFKLDPRTDVSVSVRL